MKKALKIIALFLLWFLFSPLFIYLAKHWKLMKLKYSIPLSLISPFGIILIALIIYLCYMGFFNFHRTHHFVDKEVVETITSIKLPDFEVVDYQKGNASFVGDYSDEINIRFETDLADSTFVQLDSLVKKEKSEWSKNGNSYSYSVMWGNGMTPPAGEDKDFDGFFSLQIERGKREAVIQHGTW